MFCHFRPPVPTAIGEDVGATFPDVLLDDWCGQYQRIDRANPPASVNTRSQSALDRTSHVKALA